MLQVVGYEVKWIITKGVAKKKVKSIYKSMGKGSGLRNSKDPRVVTIKGKAERL